MEGLDLASLLGGLDPSQISQQMATYGIPPDALMAQAQIGQPGASPWEPVRPPPPPAGMVGGPEGPPMMGAPGVPRLVQDPATLGQSSVGQSGATSPLVGALRGMVAPNVPQPQKVSSPNAPRPTGHVQGNNLVGLLQHLGMLRGAQMPTSYQLPSTLGAALGGR